DLPLLGNEPVDKQALKALQAAVATVAEREGLPEGLLCARRHLESLLEGRGWPPALEGRRRELLEPVLKPLLPARLLSPLRLVLTPTHPLSSLVAGCGR